MIVAGVDYGVSRVAICHLGDPSLVAPHVFDLDLRKGTTKRAAGEPTETYGDILLAIHGCAVDLFSTMRPTLVAVERPITGRSGNAKTAADMAMVAGALVLAARGAGAEVVLISPGTWKKDICGHGGLDKKQVDSWLTEHHHELRALCPTQDSVDAVCLALAAQALLGGRGAVPGAAS